MNFASVRTRIAPSPSGDWHLGTARTALFAYLFARHSGGQFFLRIEDTDRQRLIEGAETRILETIAWLGLDVDEFDGQPYVKQSDRLTRYRQVAEKLVADGAAYYCFATSGELDVMRSEQAAGHRPPRYDNRWGYRELAPAEAKKRLAAERPVVRFKMPVSGSIEFSDHIHGPIVVDASTLDDHVLLKADGWPTYHLAHVVDDYDMAISHVIRGDEWLSSAPRHVVLLDALAWPRPVYAHLPVILASDGGKLSKRHGAKPVLAYRAAGYLSDAVVNYLLLLGWAPNDNRELFSRGAMVDVFDLARVSSSPARFDPKKLDWFNREYIRQLPVAELTAALADFFAADVIWNRRLRDSQASNIAAILNDRLTTLADFPAAAEPFYARPTAYDSALLPAKGQSLAAAAAALKLARAALSTAGAWTTQNLKSALDAVVTNEGLAVGHLYLPLRYALTSRAASPGALECLTILGHEESLSRLDAALAACA